MNDVPSRPRKLLSIIMAVRNEAGNLARRTRK